MFTHSKKKKKKKKKKKARRSRRGRRSEPEMANPLKPTAMVRQTMEVAVSRAKLTPRRNNRLHAESCNKQHMQPGGSTIKTNKQTKHQFQGKTVRVMGNSVTVKNYAIAYCDVVYV